MPEPQEGETRDDFVSRCIPIVIEDGTAEDGKQAAAICNSMWEEAQKKSLDLDSLISFGGAVKMLAPDRIGGYLVQFTDADNPDLEDEYFDASTNYGFDDTIKTTVYMNHRQPLETAKGDVITIKEPIGEGTLTKDERGILIDAILYERGLFEETLEALGWSSGTASHLVDYESKGKARRIARWPLGLDASVCPGPAYPPNAVIPLKSWAATAPSLEVEPKGVENAPATAGAEEVAGRVEIETAREKPTKTEVQTMSEKNETPQADVMALEEKIESILEGQIGEVKGYVDQRLTEILDLLQKSPALKDAGYISPDSEDKDRSANKSFADFLVSIRNGNKRRLATVYGSTEDASVKALGEQSGTAGGYLVPTEYHERLMMMAMDAGIVRPRATVIPVTSNRGEVPALNQSTAPTAGKGQSAFAGGVRAYATPEAGTLTNTDPVFDLVEYNINKIGGTTKVSNELLSDSAFTIEAILSKLFGMAVVAMEDYLFIRGTGAGEPLGVLAAPCVIGVAANTNNQFMMEDATAMLSQFWPTPGGAPVWVLHRGLIPDLYLYFDVVTGGEDLVQPSKTLPTQILGYPILYSEHMPAPNTDDALLADWAAYLIFDRMGLQIAYSEHAAFTTDEGTWRFTKRLDGQPWLTAAITLADPGGAHTVSPFVYHND